MTQLIPLLLILASLAVLAVQNRSISLPLVILSSETPAIPVGLLLVVAVCIGALVTLILYALMGLIRPPESKYRPIGRRVPYPDGPGSTASSGPPGASSLSDTAYNPADATRTSSSSAFVSDPAPQTAPNPPSNPIQDSLHEDGPPRDRDSSSSAPTHTQGTASTFSSHFGGRIPSDSEPSAKPRSTINEAPSVKKKTKRLSRDQPKGVERDRKIDNDWGDVRPTEYRNSWDLSEEARNAGSNADQPGGLFDFVRPGSHVHASASRLASDIAAGWTGHPREQAPQASYPNDDGSYDGGYDGRYGRDDNRNNNRDYGSSYDSEGYRPIDHGHPSYDDLDQGWESFDHYDTPPLPNDLGEKKRVYGDSLYGHDNREGAVVDRTSSQDAYPEDAYPEDYFPEETLNEMGPDGVYEADYRVIVPPSKPLDDSDDYPD